MRICGTLGDWEDECSLPLVCIHLGSTPCVRGATMGPARLGSFGIFAVCGNGRMEVGGGCRDQSSLGFRRDKKLRRGGSQDGANLCPRRGFPHARKPHLSHGPSDCVKYQKHRYPGAGNVILEMKQHPGRHTKLRVFLKLRSSEFSSRPRRHQILRGIFKQ